MAPVLGYWVPFAAVPHIRSFLPLVLGSVPHIESFLPPVLGFLVPVAPVPPKALTMVSSWVSLLPPSIIPLATNAKSRNKRPPG